MLLTFFGADLPTKRCTTASDTYCIVWQLADKEAASHLDMLRAYCANSMVDYTLRTLVLACRWYGYDRVLYTMCAMAAMVLGNALVEKFQQWCCASKHPEEAEKMAAAQQSIGILMMLRQAAANYSALVACICAFLHLSTIEAIND